MKPITSLSMIKPNFCDVFGYKEQLLHSNKWTLSVPKIN